MVKPPVIRRFIVEVALSDWQRGQNRADQMSQPRKESALPDWQHAMNKKRPLVADGRGPRMRGGEETTKKQPNQPSCCTRPAFALSGADMLWQAIGWVRIEVWPKIVRGDLIIDSRADRDDVFTRHTVARCVKPVPHMSLLDAGESLPCQCIGERFLPAHNLNRFFY